MIFKAKSTYWYTPDIGNNISQPEAKRLRARIIRADAETREELSTLEVSREYSKTDVAAARQEAKRGVVEEGPRSTRLSFLRRQNTGRILRDHVPEIVNCQVEVSTDDGKTRIENITTGAQLASSTAYGIDALIQKLCAEVLKEELPEETEKNSASASAST